MLIHETLRNLKIKLPSFLFDTDLPTIAYTLIRRDVIYNNNNINNNYKYYIRNLKILYLNFLL